MRALKTISALPLAAALMLAACTDGATTGQVNGTVSSQLSDGNIPESAEVALVWATEDGASVTSSTIVSGDYPASFSLDLSGPPPEGALLASDPAAALGVVLALEEGADLETDEPLGFSEEIVLYLPEAAENLDDLGLPVGPIDAGYHLLRFVEPTEEQFAAIDACYEENIDALIACEDGCFDGPVDDDTELDGCIEGCWGDDPCEQLIEDSLGVEVLPIDTPIELIMLDDLDGEWDDFEDDFDDGCFDGAFIEAEECFLICDEEGADEVCFQDCEILLDERLIDCDGGFDDDFGDDFDDGCFDDAFIEADECFASCEGDFEACEQLIEDGAADEDIDACFEGAFDEGCFEGCDVALDERLGECEAELPEGPEPVEPLDPEAEQCLEDYWPQIDECYAGCEEGFAACDALFEDPDADEAAIDECLQEQDESAWTCFEGCEGLTMDAFNACGVEYDC
jgi:hypothetical protein